MQAAKPFDIFISHSSKDTLAASAIKQHLQNRGLRCWKAPDDIQPGESWPQAIMRAISNSQIMLLVWSGNSVISQEVSKELTLAMQSKLTVVPFRIEDVQASAEWAYHLANTHWMNAFEGPIEQYFDGLANYVGKIIPGCGEQRNERETKSLADLETLIVCALQDGKISPKEREVLERRAKVLGYDIAEFELILEAKIHEVGASLLDQSSASNGIASDVKITFHSTEASPYTVPSEHSRDLLLQSLRQMLAAYDPQQINDERLKRKRLEAKRAAKNPNIPTAAPPVPPQLPPAEPIQDAEIPSAFAIVKAGILDLLIGWIIFPWLILIAVFILVGIVEKIFGSKFIDPNDGFTSVMIILLMIFSPLLYYIDDAKPQKGTIGKRLSGIRLVQYQDKSGTPHFGQIFRRFRMLIFSSLFAYVPWIRGLFDDEKRSSIDKKSGVIFVKVKK
jgi:uncharacterized RDD family membrane protein YckC